MVVIDGVYAINDGMVGLAHADVEGEEGVDDDVDEGVPLRLEEAPYAESRPIFPLLEFGSLCRGSGRRREVWLFWRRQYLLPRDKSPEMRTLRSFILSSGVRSLCPNCSSRRYARRSLVVKGMTIPYRRCGQWSRCLFDVVGYEYICRVIVQTASGNGTACV